MGPAGKIFEIKGSKSVFEGLHVLAASELIISRFLDKNTIFEYLFKLENFEMSRI